MCDGKRQNAEAMTLEGFLVGYCKMLLICHKLGLRGEQEEKGRVEYKFCEPFETGHLLYVCQQVGGME